MCSKIFNRSFCLQCLCYPGDSASGQLEARKKAQMFLLNVLEITEEITRPTITERKLLESSNLKQHTGVFEPSLLLAEDCFVCRVRGHSRLTLFRIAASRGQFT